MKQWPITYSHDEFLHLKWMLEEALLTHANHEKKTREKALVLAILMGIHKRVADKAFEGNTKNKVVFKYFEAQAIVISYENGWIKAKESSPFAQNILRITYSKLHQKTS